MYIYIHVYMYIHMYMHSYVYIYIHRSFFVRGWVKEEGVDAHGAYLGRLQGSSSWVRIGFVPRSSAVPVVLHLL